MSHVRASAVFRDLDYYNERLDSRESQFGYGVQVSGEWQLGRKWTAYSAGKFPGKAWQDDIQDIAGTGLDLVPVTGDPGRPPGRRGRRAGSAACNTYSTRSGRPRRLTAASR